MSRLHHSANCPCCGIKMITPEWSETVRVGKTVNLWRCAICGKDFETTDNIVEETQSVSELTDEFFPTLLVA